MGVYTVRLYSKLQEAQKKEAVHIFVEGFAHLMTFTKDQEVLQDIFLVGFDGHQIYVCMEGEQIKGVMGLATNKVRPVSFDKACCAELLGKVKGDIVAKQMNGIFQSQVVTQDTDLYIDFLATQSEARGKGVGTTLLKYAFGLEGYRDYYIEVLSKNKTAKRLYEKLGFHTYRKDYLSIVTLMGNGYSIKMKK